MIEETSAIAIPGPSKRQIVRATMVAMLVALVISVTVVLPAEYGIDPLRTGAALGLLSLSKSQTAPASAPAPATTKDAPAEGEAPVIQGVYVAQPTPYKIDSRELKLGIGEGMEIKYHMQKGAGMVYSWQSSGKVLYEFHGEPDVKPAGAAEDYFESYQKDDAGNSQAQGTFTSPSTGIQGWFWDNESGQPATIKLVTAGFYDYILQNKDDVKTRLQPSDPR